MISRRPLWPPWPPPLFRRGSIACGVSSSLIVSVLVLVAGLWAGGSRPPWALEPATIRTTNGRVDRVRRLPIQALAATPLRDDDSNIVMDTLRVLGIVRRRVERPVVGRTAYVRWWERIRALIVLAAIVVGLGLLLAVLVGVTVLGLGFMLERAIS